MTRIWLRRMRPCRLPERLAPCPCGVKVAAVLVVAQAAAHHREAVVPAPRQHLHDVVHPLYLPEAPAEARAAYSRSRAVTFRATFAVLNAMCMPGITGHACKVKDF